MGGLQTLTMMMHREPNRHLFAAKNSHVVARLWRGEGGRLRLWPIFCREIACCSFAARSSLCSVMIGCGLLGTSWVLWGCDEEGSKPSPATVSRSQAVAASSQQAAQAKVADDAQEDGASEENPGPAALPAGDGEKKPRELCAGQWEKPGRAFQPTDMSRAAAEGSELPEEELQLGAALTWVNFWAAWCKPCKEEIPRLIGWQQRLNASGEKFRLVFVSLDDDERQLHELMNDQPKEGLKQTYWLKDGAERNEWLSAVGMDPDPELPAHLLIDGSGNIRCVLSGAVEDEDFQRVRELTSG